MLVILTAATFGALSYAGAVAKPQPVDARLAARTRLPAAATSVLSGTPEVVAVATARLLFASAPVLVADPDQPADRATAAAQAQRAAAPLLLTSPGRDGSYSYEASVASLRPWARRTRAAGMYVVLDLQAGRASLLAQARRYRPLLKLPNIGLALDPEWELQPGQLPLRQIGSVGITEVNNVSRWLARLTAHYHLPQKLLVLHQFRLSMIRDERRLDTHHDDLAILIHMDGQGTPSDKRQTWKAVIKAAPPGVHFGWKDFYTKDDPVQDPRQTMAHKPAPVMISYQ
jgi:hypothetical protein